jgi:SAM-dependent methyltransferase
MGESEKPNEQWWAEKGREWYEECQRRRKTIPYYMIHEVFLSGYFSMLGPCKVLEFGCGFGRHLSYLRRIPGLDLYGCDPSPTMLAEAKNLIDSSWLAERTLRIPPGGPLAYADKSFDVVYTASVLIHVRPEDITALLGELLRVTRWHVLHVENLPTEQAVMTSPQHSGCWAHPFASLYGELGAAVQTLPECGTLQGVYRIVLNDARPVPDVTSFAGRLLETETNFLAAQQRVQQQLAESQATAIRLQGQSDERNQQLLEQQRQSQEQQRQLTEQLAEQTAALERQRTRIAQIESQSAQIKQTLLAAQQSQARQMAAESVFLQQLQQRLKA